MTKIERLGIQDRIIELHSEGCTASEIADIVSDEMSYKVSEGVVRSFIKRYSAIKTEIAKEVVKERIVEALPQVGDILQQNLNELMLMFTNPNNTVSEKVSILAESRRTCEVVLKYFGMGEQTEQVINISLADNSALEPTQELSTPQGLIDI